MVCEGLHWLGGAQGQGQTIQAIQTSKSASRCMAQAAWYNGLDPDRLRFVHPVRVIKRKMPQAAAIPPECLASWRDALLAEIAFCIDVLRCQTPEMNHKHLWGHLLAYNVIRLLMAQAASNTGKDPRELSFKHTVQLWSG